MRTRVFGGTYIIVLASVLVNFYITQGGTFVETCKFTEFGLCVKNKLLCLGKEQIKVINHRIEDLEGYHKPN